MATSNFTVHLNECTYKDCVPTLRFNLKNNHESASALMCSKGIRRKGEVAQQRSRFGAEQVVTFQPVTLQSLFPANATPARDPLKVEVLLGRKSA